MAWNTIKLDLLRGQNIAGHAVPEFTINKEKAYAFEIRTPSSDDREPYGI